jgi:hypothetical protein
MKRRDFITMGTVGLTATLIPSACYYFRDTSYGPSLAQPQSLALIWDKETIIAIGNDYRLRVPDEKSESELVEELLRDAPDDVKALNSFIEMKIKNDFEKNNTVNVNGWILSTTEARQCALLSTLKN